MTVVPQLFDRALLRRRRTRFPEENFLMQEMRLRLEDRLADIRREFSSALHLGPPGVPARANDSLLLTDEECLSFASGSFDLVTSCGGLHWVNDLPGALSLIYNALRPDGVFLAIFPGGETLKELRDALTHASMEGEGGVSPRISPFVDVRDAGALLTRAGFALPVADSETLAVRYRNAYALMHDLRECGEASGMLARPKYFTRGRTIQEAASYYQRQYAGDDGRIPATFELIFMTGWKPHASQPKPLARGSGTHSLAAALSKNK